MSRQWSMNNLYESEEEEEEESYRGEYLQVYPSAPITIPSDAGDKTYFPNYRRNYVIINVTLDVLVGYICLLDYEKIQNVIKLETNPRLPMPYKCINFKLYIPEEIVVHENRIKCMVPRLGRHFCKVAIRITDLIVRDNDYVEPKFEILKIREQNEHIRFDG